MSRTTSLIKRPDGSKVEIEVEFWVNIQKENYHVFITVCDPGKRKFKPLFDADAWQYRYLSMPERKEYTRKKQLEFCTEEEIYAAKLKCWESLKPQKDDN